MKTVACCIPCNWDYIPIPFFASFIRMMIHGQGRYNVLAYIARSSSVNHMRTEAITRALEDGEVDYILHLDVDEIYPPDTISRLMQHIDDGKEVVGGLYCSRINPVNSAFEFIENGDLRALPVRANTGMQKVDSMGMGGMMTDVKVFDKIRKPWFFGNPMHCEDVAFCKQCKDAGIQVWVDTDLQFGHLVLEAKQPL